MENKVSRGRLRRLGAVAPEVGMNECIEWLQKVAPKGYKSKHFKNENKK
jgi:hypothetical protein